MKFSLFYKTSAIINDLSKFIGIILIFIGLVIMFTEVILRYIFSFGFIWAEEITCYAFIYAAMLGASIVSFENAQMKIDIFKKYFPLRMQKWINIGLKFLSLFFLGVLFYEGIIFFIEGLNAKSFASQISLAIPYFSIPLGAFFILIQEIKNLTELFKRKKEV